MPFEHGVLMPWRRRPQPSRLTTLRKLTKPRPLFPKYFFPFWSLPISLPKPFLGTSHPYTSLRTMSTQRTLSSSSTGKSNYSKSSLPCQESFHCSGKSWFPRENVSSPMGKIAMQRGKCTLLMNAGYPPSMFILLGRKFMSLGKSQLPSEARAFLSHSDPFSHSSCLRPGSCTSLNTYTTCTWQITCWWASTFKFIS